MNNILASYIKNNREKLGLSLRDLSKQSGVSHTEIWNIESGKKTNPSENIIKKICIGLNLNYDDLVLETGYNKKNTEYSEYKSKSINNSYRNNKLSIYNIVEEYLSLNFKEFTFTKEYPINYSTRLDFVGFSEDNKVICAEVKYLSNNNRPVFNNIKSLFADFYFNFKSKFTDDSMKFLVIIIVNDIDSYNSVSKVIKSTFNCLFPIFDYRIYIEKDMSNLIK